MHQFSSLLCTWMGFHPVVMRGGGGGSEDKKLMLWQQVQESLLASGTKW